MHARPLKALFWFSFSFFFLFQLILFVNPPTVQATPWTQVGSGFTNGSELRIYKFNGEVYAITNIDANTTRVYKLVSGSWNTFGDITSTHNTSPIGYNLTSHAGELYALVRVSVAPNGNKAQQIFRWNGSSFVDVTDPFNLPPTGSGGARNSGFVSFNGKIYIGTTGWNGNSPESRVYEWDPAGRSVSIVGQGSQISYNTTGGGVAGPLDLVVVGGSLYTGSDADYNTSGIHIGVPAIYRWDNTAGNWTMVAKCTNSNCIGGSDSPLGDMTTNGTDIFGNGSARTFSWTPGGGTSLNIIGNWSPAYGGNTGKISIEKCSGTNNLITTAQEVTGGNDFHLTGWQWDGTSWTQLDTTGDEIGTEAIPGGVAGENTMVTLENDVYQVGEDTITPTVYKYTGTAGCSGGGVSATIQGFVWNDNDLSTTVNNGESNKSGVTVNLTGAASASTVTTATGQPGTNYAFTNLGAGTYYVDAPAPMYFYNTTTTPVTVVISASGSTTVNFGLVQHGTINGYIWLDQPGGVKCVRDAGELNYIAKPVRVHLTRTTSPVLEYDLYTNPWTTGNNYGNGAIVPGTYTEQVMNHQDGTTFPPFGYEFNTQTSDTFVITAGEPTQAPIANCLP